MNHRMMRMGLKSFNVKSLNVLMVTATLLGSILAIQLQQVQASDDREAGPNDNAVQAGWKEGKNDYLNGDAFEYDCPSSNTDTYCSLYRTGYGQGWSAQENLGRGQGSDPR